MKTWEYKIVDSNDVPGRGIFRGKDRSEVEQYLNEFGQEGWEIINLDFHEFDNRMSFCGIAKRERPELDRPE